MEKENSFFGEKEKKEFGEDLVEKKKKEENIWRFPKKVLL